jgi:hypothetical protein
MKNNAGLAAVVAGLFIVAVYGAHRLDVLTRNRQEAQALERIGRWPYLSSLAARQMIEKYGPPQGILADRVVWDFQRPWKRISVFNTDASPLEEVVDYDGPAYKFEKPLLFPYGSRVYAFDRELAARSNGEELNRLCLNLADDIARGHRTAEDARRFYLKTIELAVSGKSSPYMERLRFEVPPEQTAPYPMAHY